MYNIRRNFGDARSTCSAHQKEGSHDEKLHTALESVGGRDAGSPVKLNIKLKYTHRVIHCVNNTEDEAIGQKRRSLTGEIKVSTLLNKRTKQGCPRLVWVMFHKICGMLRCVHKSKSSHITRIMIDVVVYPTNVITGVVYKHKPRTNARVKQHVTEEEACGSLDNLTTLLLDLK